MKRRYLLLVAASLALSGSLAFTAAGCGEDEPANTSGAQPADDATRVHGLTEAEAAQTLVKVGDTNITLGDFANELASKGSFIRTRYSSPERRREFLDQMIRFELLAQEAERRGYDDLPEVQRSEKQMMIRRFLEERFDQSGPEEIPDADVRAYYESHRTEFHTPEQVRASHIQLRDRRTASRVLTQLLAAPNDLRLYRSLAEQHNTDTETRDRFGDLRFFSRPAERTEGEPVIPDAVAEAAFAIDRIGALHPEVVEADGAFHIVKLTGRRAPMHRTLEEADRPIRSRLHRERREEAIQALITRLRAESDVEEHLDVLGEVRLDLPEGDSPTVTHPQLDPTQLDPTQRPAGPSGPIVPAPPTKAGGAR
jgi:parvulin-like peptidyl-prolyl isomerase